jgi:integrase
MFATTAVASGPSRGRVVCFLLASYKQNAPHSKCGAFVVTNYIQTTYSVGATGFEPATSCSRSRTVQCPLDFRWMATREIAVPYARMLFLEIPGDSGRLASNGFLLASYGTSLEIGMATANLTKRTIDALAFTPACDYFVWDRKLSGFGIRVTERAGADGQVRRRKAFVLGYRPCGSRQYRRLTLGLFGPLTAEQAREQALHHLSATTKGSDPVAERRAARAGVLVREVGKAFLDEVERRRKPGTFREYKRLWNKHVLPALGTKPVAAVTGADIRRLHRSLHETPYVANRVVARLSTFFAYAIAEGSRPSKDNPTDEVEFFPEKARERFLNKEEFGRLGKALAQAETVGLPAAPETRKKPKKPENQKHRPKTADVPIPANSFAVAAIRLLALTGCRENEILSLRWDAVDFERGHLRLEDTKTGRSVRPLGQAAAAVLESLPRIQGNPHVLPGLKPKSHLMEIKRVWYAVRFAAKLNGLRLHDLRHSFASVPATSGESLLVVRSLLGHKNVATTERYAHLGNDPVKRAADKTAGEIATWMRQEI